MNILIASSPFITDKYWIEAEIIDGLYHIDLSINDTYYVTDIHLPGNKIIFDYLMDLKYNICVFESSFAEHGLGAVSHRNLLMFTKNVNYALLFDHLHSHIIQNLRNLCVSKQVPFNMRFYNNV